MKTSNKQISLFTEGKSTSSREDFLANHTVQQGSYWAKNMNVISGQKCLEQFKKFNQPGLWARTFADLLIGMEGWYSMRCKLTWKLKGTKYNRLYFQLVPSTLHTDETGFGLLPTPTSVQRDHPERVQKLKESGANTIHSRKQGELRPNSVLDAIMFYGMLPTPTASSDAKGGCTRPNPKRQNATLAHAIHGVHGKTGKTSQLNPRFVAEMMGFPPNWTELPFQNGETNLSKDTETQ